MADEKIRLIIEALDKSKDAFTSLDNSIRNLETGTQKTSINTSGYLEKIKQNWMGLSAAAYAAWQTIQKALNYIEKGAKAIQAEAAFDNMSKSLGMNKEKWLSDMNEAAAGTVDASHQMQKAIKATTQDIDPDKIPALFDAARVSAVKSGADVKDVADSLTDSIANQMPRGLRQFGLISKDEMSTFNKAVSSGVENLNLLDLVLANATIQKAKMGVETYNAAIAVQKFKAETEELQENIGTGLIWILQKVIGAFQGIASTIFYAIQAYHEFSAAMTRKELANFGDNLDPNSVAARRKSVFQKQLDYHTEMAKNANAIASGLANKALDNTLGTASSGQVKTQADLDAAAKKAEENKAKILAEMKRLATLQQQRELAKQELAQYTADQNAELAVLKEHNKAIMAENEALYKQGQITEQEWLKTKESFAAQDLVNEKQTLENIKTATEEAYAKMAKLFPASGKEAERQVLIAEGVVAQKKLQGEIDLKNAQLQTNLVQGELDQLQLSQKVAKAKRDGELSVLEAQASLEKEINAIKVQRGEITSEKAAYEEYQWQLKILALKKENLQLDYKTAADTEKVTIAAQIASLDQQLNDVYVKAEKSRRDELTKTYAGSLQLSLEETATDLMNLYSNVSSAVKNTFNNMTDTLTEFVTTGKASFSDFANSVIKDLVRIMIQQNLTGPLASSAGSWLKDIFSGASAVASRSNTYLLSEKGNIFSSGKLVPFAKGGVVFRPTIFPMATGAGLMGEAGPEAVMPLKRLSNGNLGVQTEGNQQQVNIKVELNNKSGTQLQSTQSSAKFNGQEYVVSVVIDALNRNAYGLRAALTGA